MGSVILPWNSCSRNSGLCKAQVIQDRATGRSKGFGFVEMDNDAQAQAAIEGLHEREVDGRRLTVNEARPREDRGGGGGGYGGRRRPRRSWRRRRRWWLRRWWRLWRWRWPPVLIVDPRWAGCPSSQGAPVEKPPCSWRFCASMVAANAFSSPFRSLGDSRLQTIPHSFSMEDTG